MGAELIARRFVIVLGFIVAAGLLVTALVIDATTHDGRMIVVSFLMMCGFALTFLTLMHAVIDEGMWH